MRRIKRKESGFAKFARRLFVLCAIVFVVGNVALNSLESSLNIKCKNVQDEINTIKSDIDGLDMKKLELATFTRVQSIANAKGYDYKQSTMTAAVVGVERD